jgi:hypothetical protein
MVVRSRCVMSRLTLGLAVLAVLGLSGCGNSNDAFTSNDRR